MKVFRAIGNAIAPLGIPLAWRQLSADRKRLATAVAGVGFGVMLMLFQLGLYNAINTMVVSPHANLRGDLFMMSPDFEYFGSNREFTRRRVYQARALPEVEWVAPIYCGFFTWSNPVTGVAKTIFAIGVNPSENPFTNQGITSQMDKLGDPEAVLFDTLSQSAFGSVQALLGKKGFVETQIQHKRAVVKGLFTMGPTLAASGNLIMGDEAFFHFRPDKPRNMANVGIVVLKPGTDAAVAAEKLRAILPDDVRIETRDDFIRHEQEYWNKRTPTGFVVGAGMMVGMLVGAIVVYQILYTDVNDHLKEYATLKAMGIADSFFVLLVLQEALILVGLGSIPAVIFTLALNRYARTQVSLPAYLDFWQTVTVLAAVSVMCLLAGQLATRRLRSADPANVF